jgi:hypothetical protein
VKIPSGGACAAIIELLDGDGNVSAPRRVAFPAAADCRPGPAWPLGILLVVFALAPFVVGYAGGRMLLSGRFGRL